MTTEALKPCPFCGNEEPYFERLGDAGQSCIVACGNCGAQHESSDEGDRNGISWNERVALAAQAQEPAADPDLVRGFRRTGLSATEAVEAARGLARLQAPAQGWKLVPEEITPDMMSECWRGLVGKADHATIKEAWRRTLLAAPASAAQSEDTSSDLHKFLNAAAGEGFVLDGVDAADLYVQTFPKTYAKAVSQIDTGAYDDAAMSLAAKEQPPVTPYLNRDGVPHHFAADGCTKEEYAEFLKWKAAKEQKA